MGYNRSGNRRKQRLKRRLREERRLAARWVEIDPRTLEAMGLQADCHLLPEWCGMSGITVRLGRQMDNDLGSACDSELATYLNNLFGRELPGRVAMGVAARGLTSTYHSESGDIAVHPPRRGDPQQFLERAMGATSGEAELRSFQGEDADGQLAGLSAIHSAMLVLYYFRHPIVYGTSFDTVRACFASAIAGNLSDDQRANIQARVHFVFLAPANAVPETGLDLGDYRALYDPDRSMDDGVDTHFPFRSVREFSDFVVIALPYSRNIRAYVMFRKVKRHQRRQARRNRLRNR